MLELLAAAIVQLPSTDVKTALSILQTAGPKVREPIAGARIRAFVKPNGKVTDCEVISRFGKQASADELCRAFEGKTVKPAADIDGTPISGFIETTLWLTPGRDTEVKQLPDRPPEAQLTVKRLPEGVADPFRLTIALIIDQTGAVATCGPVKAENEALAVAACQAVKDETFPLVRDANDNAVRYVRPYDVGFTVAPAVPE